MLFLIACLILVSTANEVKEEASCPTQRTQKVALITGITGQDGSYLAELLLEKGYKYV
jgi:hypothetical protein